MLECQAYLEELVVVSVVRKLGWSEYQRNEANRPGALRRCQLFIILLLLEFIIDYQVYLFAH
jgi:hypothetical protein